MTTVFDVAAEFVRRSFDPVDPEESDLPTPSRLQKWVFYAQGWSLGLLGRPLFAEPIEAWPNGPVVPELHRRLIDYKMNVVPPEEFADSSPLEPIQAAIVEQVWREYAPYSAGRLCEMARSEPPWVEARQATDGGASVIRIESLERHFYGTAKGLGGGIDPRDVWRGEEQYLSGSPLVPAERVFAE